MSEDQNLQNEIKDILPQKPKKKIWLWAGIILIILIILAILRTDEDTWIKDKAGNWIKHGNPSGEAPKDSSSGPVSIPEKVLNNKFGWLGGGTEDEGTSISDRGGAWVRPHPGAFVWDMMQKSKDGEIDFSLADETVQNYSKNNIAIMATIWPFADWDQKNLSNANDCKVASNDEFLPKNDKKGRGSYLPLYRCNPSDWTAYQNFVEKVVERYDGDGKDDMPKLAMPIKYWEVMNEPDLQWKSNMPMISEDRSLNFYKLGPLDYGELLKKTYPSIKNADSSAQVLIAGAAGADERMLSFYETLFMNMADAPNYFDIANVHCISNDQATRDFNVGPYKKVLETVGITQKPIWVTEAEAMYGKSGEENFQNTKTSTANAIKAGASRIFFTRYEFSDFRKDMSEKISPSKDEEKASEQKYQQIISQY